MRLARWVLNADEVCTLGAGMFYHVEPVSLAMCTSAIKLRVRHSRRPILKTARHRFDLDPPHWLPIGTRLKQIKARIMSWRRLEPWLAFDNEGYRLTLEL